MRERHFETDLWLPRSREEVFDFFSNAANLDRITPPWLRFKMLAPSPIEMRAGALIDYRLRLRGIPIRWRTKITVWEPPRLFLDEQIRGPYQLWIHEHRFESRHGGTLVQDRIRYAVALDFIVHRFLVRPDVERIFAFRQEKLRTLFGGPAEQDRLPDWRFSGETPACPPATRLLRAARFGEGTSGKKFSFAFLKERFNS